MKCYILAALTLGTAHGERYVAAGQPPICEVSADGRTHVFFKHSQHTSFKCTHSGATCSCTLKHPTHNKGGCREIESKLAGKLMVTAGDCTDSGKDDACPADYPYMFMCAPVARMGCYNNPAYVAACTGTVDSWCAFPAYVADPTLAPQLAIGMGSVCASS